MGSSGFLVNSSKGARLVVGCSYDMEHGRLEFWMSSFHYGIVSALLQPQEFKYGQLLRPLTSTTANNLIPVRPDILQALL